MMKVPIFYILTYFLIGVLGCSAQNSVEPKLFAMIYTTGDNWDDSKEFQEQTYFMPRSRHLSKLRKEVVIPIGGRYGDKGFMLLKAKDRAAAEAIIKLDSSVTYKTFNVELHEFEAFYKGCRGEKNIKSNEQ